MLEKRDSVDDIGGIVVDERQNGRARAGEGSIVVCTSCPSLEGNHQYGVGDRLARSHLFEQHRFVELAEAVGGEQATG